MTPRTDATAAAAIAGRGLAATASAIGEIHSAISARVFARTGRPSVPVRVVHDGITKTVYAAVENGAKVASFAAGQVAGAVVTQRNRAGDYVRLTDRRHGGAVIGALNGAWGDTFAKWRNPLALDMTIRVGDTDVDLDRASLTAAFPAPTGDLVVFLHGLCETDRSWWRQAEEQYGDAESTHGSRLRELTGSTPIYLRYNSGLHISDNGAQLATLLDAVCTEWPVEVTSLTLVGHSMGGLVIRSACCLAMEERSDWLDAVRRIVYLGSPHLGAPLEVAATAAGVALRRLPETRPLASALASRSVGIKDLRYGDVRPSDWADIRDPDAWREAPIECAPLLATAEHFYIGATLTRNVDHVVARMVGDALVTFPSASGDSPRRQLAFEVDRGRHLGGLNHFDLLNHPRVWELMESWLG
jgi:pimeloyl-ACP methyl ester carboxylesterase